MAATLRAKSPAEVLVMVPNLFGFHLRDSLAVVSLGAGAEVFHARVDHPHSLAGASYVAQEIAEVFGRNGRTGRRRQCLLISYTDSADDARQAVEVMAEGLQRVGVEVRAALRADAGRWFCVSGCTDESCPEEGTPYDVAAHPLTAQWVAEGHAVPLSGREELEASLRGDAADQLSLNDAAARVLEVSRDCGRMADEGRWIQRRVREFLTDGYRLAEVDAARMVAAVTRTSLRDVAWAEMGPANASRHVDLWADLVRRSPEPAAAPVSALLSFAAWLSGNGALGRCAVDLCQRSNPDYSMAQLVAAALDSAMPPTAWSPVSPEDLEIFTKRPNAQSAVARP